MLSRKQQIFKRIFDVLFALIALVITFLPQLILIFIASIIFGGSGVFSQNRIGYKGRVFKIYKIKSLKNDLLDFEFSIQKNGLTGFGQFIRKFKLDELPQFWNILKGDMSVVGPRPDIEGYADQLKDDDRMILEVKPGLTGLATLQFFDEDVILEKQENPKKFNDEIIWKEKIALNKAYVENYTFLSDLKIIWKSFVLILNKFSF
jgi:lipopolysaccharide/colanic/teichoic acid biosynthesis glycosyltransferase